MNKKLILAFVVGAFALAACSSQSVEISRQKTKKGDRVFTETKYQYDEDNRDSSADTVYRYEYFVEEPDTGRVYEVVPCTGGFCKTPKEEAQYQEDLAALDKKNKRVVQGRRGHKGFATNSPTEDEVDIDSGGSGY